MRLQQRKEGALDELHSILWLEGKVLHLQGTVAALDGNAVSVGHVSPVVVEEAQQLRLLFLGGHHVGRQGER